MAGEGQNTKTEQRIAALETTFRSLETEMKDYFSRRHQTLAAMQAEVAQLREQRLAAATSASEATPPRPSWLRLFWRSMVGGR